MMKAMDESNVKKAVIFGMPIIKKWNATEPIPPKYYLDDDAICYYYMRTDEIVAEEYLKLSKKNQDRFVPLLCGFNPTDRFAVDYVREMLDKYPFFRGIGEILCRHDDLTNITQGEVARPNHAAMKPIYELCAERNLPVLLHQNSTSIGGVDSFRYMHELEEVLKHHPDTTFIWAHVGISRRIYHDDYHVIVDSTLTKYPNLYVDLSWVVYEEVICENLVPKPQWLDTIKKHVDRIFIGSDVVGEFEKIGPTMAKYNKLLEMLDDSEAKKVAYRNAQELWFAK